MRVASRAAESDTLEKIEKRPGKRLVYNFEVEGTHSYFVGDANSSRAGANAGNALWVHNYTPLVPLAESAFNSAVVAGGESFAGYTIYGAKGMIGKTFSRNIFSIDASGPKSLGSLRQLAISMENEARMMGANKISIGGTSIHNQGFLNPAIAKRFGFSYYSDSVGNVILQEKL